MMYDDVDINQVAQNNPELIVRDLEGMIDPALVRQILLYRGVNKWFAVRQYIIDLKHRWKGKLSDIGKAKQEAKVAEDWAKYHELKGYEKALIDVTQQIRALCNSPRDVAWKVNSEFKIPEDFPDRPHKNWFICHGKEG